MRRTDRERSDTFFKENVLAKSQEMFLAMQDGDYPYCLPLNFVWEKDHIYIHSALQGHKLDCLRANSHVAFAMAMDVEIDREAASTYYKSVCGKGQAHIVENELEKCHALEILGQKYMAKCPQPCPPATAARVQIIRVDIVELQGKECEKRLPDNNVQPELGVLP